MKPLLFKEKTEASRIVFDPVCCMEIDSKQAFVRWHNGKMHYFCCPECKKAFEVCEQKKLFSLFKGEIEWVCQNHLAQFGKTTSL